MFDATFKKHAVDVAYVEVCLFSILFHCFAAMYYVLSPFSVPLIKTPFATQDDTVNKNVLSGWLNQG